jgi:hypothetical protein
MNGADGIAMGGTMPDGGMDMPCIASCANTLVVLAAAAAAAAAAAIAAAADWADAEVTAEAGAAADEKGPAGAGALAATAAAATTAAAMLELVAVAVAGAMPVVGFTLAAVAGSVGLVMSWMEARRLSFLFRLFRRMKYFCA